MRSREIGVVGVLRGAEVANAQHQEVIMYIYPAHTEYYVDMEQVRQS